MILVKRAPVLVHERIAGPGFGNHHHHRVRQRIATHDEQLERVVERRRIRLAVVDEGPQLRQILTENLRCDRAFPRANPVEVAAQRIDLAVMRNKAKRVREIPRRKRIGGKALVHHRQRRDHRLVGKIEIELADLMSEQHPLVDDGARRQRRDVEFLAVAQPHRLDRVAGALADHVELALQRILVEIAHAAADEHLADYRLDFLCAFGQAAVVGGHVAPAEQHLAFRQDRALDFLLARHPRGRFPRQEHHADAIVADGR